MNEAAAANENKESSSFSSFLSMGNAKFVEFALSVMINCTKDNTEEAEWFLHTYRRYVNPMELWRMWLSHYTILKYNHSDPHKCDNMMEFLLLWFRKFFKFDIPKEQRAKVIDILLQLHPPKLNDLKLLLIWLYRRKLRRLLRLEESRSRSTSGALDGLALSIKKTPSTESSLNSTPTSTPTKPNLKKVQKMPSSADMTHLLSLSSSSAGTPNTSQPTTPISASKSQKDFLSQNTQYIANALTLHDFSIFAKIGTHEILMKSGWTTTRATSVPSLDAMSKRFNDVSLWVATEILGKASDRSQQAEVIEKFIDIADKLEQLNNFNTLLAILSGLNNSAIHRLKQTWGQVSSSAKKQFAALEELMSPTNNFKNYKAALAERKLPILPYFGLFLRDLLFLSENEKFHQDGTVNTEPLKIVHARITQLKYFLSTHYNLPASVDQAIRLQIIEDEDVLYQLSLKSEPSVWENVSDSFMQEDAETDSSLGSSTTASTTGELEEFEWQSRSHSLSDPASISPSPMMSSENLLSSMTTTTLDEVVEITDKERRKSISKIKKKRKSIKIKKETHTVGVPESMLPVFQFTERQVEKYFANSQTDFVNGIIEVFDERYILLRGASLSYDFHQVAGTIFNLETASDTKEFIANFLYDLGHSIGMNDSRLFSTKMRPRNPIEALAAGPIHSSFTGWGFYHIHGDSNPTPDQHFFLHYDQTYSFEANSFKSQTQPQHVCTMNAGYMSGWCEVAFGLPLTCVEVTCRATGASSCTFVVATPSKIESYVNMVASQKGLSSQEISKLTSKVPTSLSADKYKFDQRTAGQVQSGRSRMVKGLASVGKTGSRFMLTTNPQISVLSPESQEEIADKCTQQAAKLFGEFKCNPKRAKVKFKERPKDRYVFVRAKALSTEFFSKVKDLFGNEQGIPFLTTFLFDLGRSIGRTDEKHLISHTTINSPLERFYMLPHIMSKTGWGKMDISHDSVFQVARNNVLIKYTMKNSCEACAWRQTGEYLKPPHLSSNTNDERPYFAASVCIMNSGYCSGFASNAFGIRLFTVEVSCFGRGDQECVFLMSTPDHIEEHVKAYLVQHNRPAEEMESFITLQIVQHRKQQSQTNLNSTS